MKPGTIARVVVQEQLRYSPPAGAFVKLLVKREFSLDCLVTRWKAEVLTHHSKIYLPGNITYVDEHKLEVVNPKLMKALYG